MIFIAIFPSRWLRWQGLFSLINATALWNRSDVEYHSLTQWALQLYGNLDVGLPNILIYFLSDGFFSIIVIFFQKGTWTPVYLQGAKLEKIVVNIHYPIS